MDVKEKLVELIYQNSPRLVEEECKILANRLISHGVTVQDGKDNDVPTKWIPVSEPPTEYRDKYGELIPFLVCLEGTEYPFRAMYDGKVWGDGLGVIPVKYWMPLPQPPKGE